MHEVVRYAAIRALAVSRESIQDVQALLEPFARWVKLDLHLHVIFACVEEVVHFARRYCYALPGRQHDLADGLGEDAHIAFLCCKRLRIGAVPMCRILSAWCNRDCKQGVFSVRFAAVFLEDCPVSGHRRPDSATSIVDNARRCLAEILVCDIGW